MKIPFAWIGLFALALPGIGVAASFAMKPGLWEITTTMEMPGMPMQMPAQANKWCYTAQNLKERDSVVPKPQQTGDTRCEVKDFKQSGNTVRWTLECAGAHPTRAKGEQTFDSADEYHARMEITAAEGGRSMAMTQKIRARRIGDCSK